MGGADSGIMHVFKLGYSLLRPQRGSEDDIGILFHPDHALVDFSSIDPTQLDVSKIVADCDYVKSIAEQHPKELIALVEAYVSSPNGFSKAAKIADKIGLTEDASIKAGGGVAWLAGLLILALLSKACVDAESGNPQGKPKAKAV